MGQELFEQEENTKLAEVIKESGLDLSESEQIKQSYTSYFIEIAEIKELAKKIDFENPSELDEKIARDLRLRMVKVRTGSENVKNERKRIHMLKADVEQKAWNLIKSGCQLEEEIFLQVEKKREIAEKARQEQLKAERLEILMPLGFQYENGFNLGQMDEAMFQSLVKGLEVAKKEKEESEAKAEAEILENLRLDNLVNKRSIEIAPYIQFNTEPSDLRAMSEDDYNKLLTSLQTAKKEYDKEQEAIRLENEKLKKEAEKKEVERLELIKKQESESKKLAEQQAKEKAIADEKLLKEREQAQAILDAERKAKEELEAQIKAKEYAEKKRIADEKAKKEAEAKAKLDAEKKLAKASDKVKLTDWLNSIAPKEFDATVLKDESGKVYNEIFDKFEGFKSWAEKQINQL